MIKYNCFKMQLAVISYKSAGSIVIKYKYEFFKLIITLHHNLVIMWNFDNSYIKKSSLWFLTYYNWTPITRQYQFDVVCQKQRRGYPKGFTLEADQKNTPLFNYHAKKTLCPKFVIFLLLTVCFYEKFVAKPLFCRKLNSSHFFSLEGGSYLQKNTRTWNSSGNQISLWTTLILVTRFKQV